MSLSDVIMSRHSCDNEETLSVTICISSDRKNASNDNYETHMADNPKFTLKHGLKFGDGMLVWNGIETVQPPKR